MGLTDSWHTALSAAVTHEKLAELSPAWLAPLLCTFDTEREQNCPTRAKAAKAEGENLAQGRQPGLFLLSCLDSVHKTLALPCSGLCKSMV